MMDFKIREAVPTDWVHISSLLIERDLPLDSLEAAYQRYLHKLDSALECVLVAVVGGQQIGFAMAHQWDEYLMSGRKQMRFSTLEVLPEYRQRGVGRALFEGIITWAKQCDATWLEWYASPSAIAFYERLGFKGDPCPQPESPYYEIDFTQS